jgi:hypothetical protein
MQASPSNMPGTSGLTVALKITGVGDMDIGITYCVISVKV